MPQPESRPDPGLSGHRGIAIIGAASSIGIRPYDDRSEARHLDRAPAVLRELGLVERLDAEDLGDVVPPAYRDFARPPGGIRNEDLVGSYSRVLADHITDAHDRDRFVLLLGGDCSIILGSLLGLSRRTDRIGLAYVDAHADFFTPGESLTGSAAGMCLGLALSRGNSPLSSLRPPDPLIRGEDVVVIGRRAREEARGLAAAGVLDLPDPMLAEGAELVATAALQRLGSNHVDGFWIHVDADVLNPRVLPAVDTPEPGGPDVDDLVALVRPLVDHPKALGLQTTIYDPGLDPDRSSAKRLIDFLTRALDGRKRRSVESTHAPPPS